MQCKKIICAIDTGDLNEAIRIVERLGGCVGAFKIGHALTLPYGLGVMDRLRRAGADRIFLDLKFHDIPNSVALAVREACRHGVWMMTLHTAGGTAMMSAAAEEARTMGAGFAPLLMGVSVLTSLDERALQQDLGVNRTVEQQMLEMSRLAIESGLDGVICPAPHITTIRRALGHEGVIVTPGIRLASGPTHDQVQVGSAEQALADGADYLVIGRALVDNPEPEAVLAKMGFPLTV